MFIDLVVCTYPLDHRKYLYIAPAFSHFEEGDEVIVQEADGKRTAIVQDCETFQYNDDKYRFVVNAMGATTPLRRIVSKVIYHELNWTHEETEAVE